MATDGAKGAAMGEHEAVLIAKARDRSALIGIVGLGYVGLPLAVEFAEAGYTVLGFDVTRRVVDGINAGHSHVQDVPDARLAKLAKAGKMSATTDLARLKEPDLVAICVPTPLSKTHDRERRADDPGGAGDRAAEHDVPGHDP